MRFLRNLLLGLVIVSAAFSFVPCQGAQIHFDSATRASQLTIIINEIMYDPLSTEVEGEWVELHNPMSTSVDVTNWSLSDQEGAADFIFPALLFPAGGYALVHVGAGQNSSDFVNGLAEFFMWRTTALLSNTGDDILLADSGGSTVDFVSYGLWDGGSVHSPPPDFNYTHSNATAQEGFSLARIVDTIRASVPTPLCPNGDDSTPSLLLIEVHYYAWGENEFFAIHNPLDLAVDISSWYLTDLEGKIAFPTGTIIASHQTLTIAQNSTNYMAQTLELPDFEYADAHPSVQEMANIGSFPSLANSGDELFLLNNFGTHVDAFVYGGSFYSEIGWGSDPTIAQPQGRIAKRNFDNGYADTNTSSDWENIRQYVVGQSDFSATQYSTQNSISLFVSPDSSYNVLTGLLDNATESVWLTVYELTGNHLADRLVAAIGRGVEVRIFLEAAPVGGITSQELFIARRIADAGGQVRLFTNDPDNEIYARYSYVHAKYAVIDNDTLLMMSENWGSSGVPLPGKSGNRGWGAVVPDPGVAGYFAGVFFEDWNPERTDSVAFDQYHTLWSAGSNSTDATSSFNPLFPSKIVTSPSVLVPVLVPDTSLDSDTIHGMLDSASERVLVEEFYIYKHWGDRSTGSVETTPNVYLESVIDAARRGCEVRILLDATFYNAMEDDPIDNDNTVDYVNAIAAAEGLDMVAKMVNLEEHDFEKIHNKGLIADDSVLISSINWNLNSVTRNRESGLIIKNSDAADYFAAVFDHDWIDDLTPPFAHFRMADSYLVNITLSLNATTSSDNSGIVNYTWTLDGQATCYDLYFVHLFDVPGQYLLNLTVRDASGNVGSYVGALNITEELSSDSDDVPEGDEGWTPDSSMNMMVAVLLVIPIFIFVAVLLVARIRK